MGSMMDMVDFGSPLLQVLSAPAVVVLVVLAVLTMRAVRLRDRAMLFGKGDRESQTRRSAYEQRWRGGLPSA